MKPTQPQQGFTLIELVVVIVILGILAATALPRFIDLSTEAGDAAAQGVAGGISSAFAINYAGRRAGSTQAVAYTFTAANVCTKANLDTVMQTPLPTNYTYAVGTGLDCSLAANDGGSFTCTITPPQGAAATATGICAQ